MYIHMFIHVYMHDISGVLKSLGLSDSRGTVRSPSCGVHASVRFLSHDATRPKTSPACSHPRITTCLRVSLRPNIHP